MQVVLNPSGFYRDMQKTGGYVEPLIYTLVIGAVAGVIAVVISIFGAGLRFGAGMGIASLIFMPIAAMISSFFSGAIMFVIWKLMGSTQRFETAWRCVAYSMAVFPIMLLLQSIPYLGSIIGLALIFWLMFHASVEVHAIDRSKAKTVLGILAVVMILLNVSSERTARKFQAQMEEYSGKLEGIENMTPEEVGEALGKFLKGLEKAQQQE